MIVNNHLQQVDGALGPQPWMQLRQVATAVAEAQERRYPVTGGQAKNEELQAITVGWVNRSPIPQYAYGLVTQAGSRVTLQCRSRGYLRMSHGVGINTDPMPVEVSRFGGGADIGMGGLLAIGTAFGTHELRSHSTTIPLFPQLRGWFTVLPGQTLIAKVAVHFVSDYWERTSIDGGDSNTDSSLLAGELRTDIFAVPKLS